MKNVIDNSVYPTLPFRSRLLCGLMLGATATAWAPAVAAQVEETADSGDRGEIIVTARRVSESLQDVPMTITAVTDEDLKNLNLFNGADLAAVSPGLTLATDYGASDSRPSLRGASSFSEATVQTYINEGPANATLIYQGLYDIGQVEVLRGPQGTLRGQPASSGAITVTTARPDLDDFKGSAAFAVSNRDGQRGEGAVSIPIVPGVIGIRLAALMENSNPTGVRSLNSRQHQYNDVRSWRASLRVEPTSNLALNIVYQDFHLKRGTFPQVAGTGYRGPGLPANFNGPAIGEKDRLAVSKTLAIRNERHQFITGQAAWDIGDHHQISYAGSYMKTTSTNYGVGYTSPDTANFLPVPLPDEKNGFLDSSIKTSSQELRLQSSGNRLIDYGVGLYHFTYSTQNGYNSIVSYLPGVIGTAPNLSLDLFNPYYSYTLAAVFPIKKKADAIYANATLHISSKTDLFVGARYSSFKYDNRQNGTLVDGVVATGAPLAFCPVIPDAGGGPAFPSPVRVGQCDLPLADMVILSGQTFKATYHPWVYSASLTHRFTEDLTVYASFGRSWRAGTSNGALNSTDPRVTNFRQVSPETSNNYEIGLKARLFDNKVLLNVAAFQQDFNGFVYRIPFFSYLSNTSNPPTVQRSQFFSTNADARIRGFEISASYHPSSRFYLDGAINYARGRLADAPVPCNDSNFDGIADSGVSTVAGFQGAGIPIAVCDSDDATSTNPDWSATLQAEYNWPVTQAVEAYVRTLSTYSPKNRYASPGFTANSYALINLYIGARDSDGGWDVGVYAKNLTDATVVLARGAELPTLDVAQSGLGVGTAAGYHPVTTTPRREIGATARFSF